MGSLPNLQEEASEHAAGAGPAVKDASVGDASVVSLLPVGNATAGVGGLLAFGSFLPAPADLVQSGRALAESQNMAVISLTITLVVVVGVLLIALVGMRGGWPWGQKSGWGEEAHEPLFGQQSSESFCRRRQPAVQDEGPAPPTEASPSDNVVVGPAARRKQRASAHAAGTCPSLCHGLVVPQGSDCVLAVRPAPRRKLECVVDISDLRGKPVLKAHVVRPHQWGKVDTNILVTMGWNFSHAPAVRLSMLDTVKDGQRIKGSDSKALTLCHGGGGGEGRPAMFVYDGDGRYFGTLAKAAMGQSRYVFATHAGDKSLHFDGLFSDNAVCISSPTQYRIAETEPCRMAFDLQNEFYRLRCSGTVDVGLIITCLLCIGEMEAFAPP